MGKRGHFANTENTIPERKGSSDTHLRTSFASNRAAEGTCDPGLRQFCRRSHVTRWWCPRRYTSLHEPLQIRRENLEEALQLQQFLRDVDDEMSWIREKESLASSADLGSSLSSVQSLQKKHQVGPSLCCVVEIFNPEHANCRK